MEHVRYLLESSYVGVNHSLSGNGGVQCYEFITVKQRVVDTLSFTVIFSFFLIPRVLKGLSLPSSTDISDRCLKETSSHVCGFRTVLLVLLTLLFGIEVGYKIVKQTWIYLLNPCHVITVLQIFLLSAKPSRLCTFVFRLHFHLLYGTILALLFPVLNTLDKPGEQAVYWLQHILISFVVPTYLLRTGGPYTCEPLLDFSWVFLSIVVFFFYMMYFLQFIAMTTLVNLNSVLCPAVSDPFYGPFWRWFAMVHQPLLITIFGKVYKLGFDKLSIVFLRDEAYEVKKEK